MAFSARLDLDPLSDVRVVDFSYNLNRDIDPTGRPAGGVRGGTIQITIEASSNTSMFEWMTDPTTKKSGTIKVMDEASAGASLKELAFEDAYIVEYGENFHWQGGENMLETFVVSAKKIKMGGGEHENEWPGA
jgi:hypothetical protein